MTPATAYTKAVCERASKDGWGLVSSHLSITWFRGNEEHKMATIRDPLYGHSARYDLWLACCFLAQCEYPDLKVTVD